MGFRPRRNPCVRFRGFTATHPVTLAHVKPQVTSCLNTIVAMGAFFAGCSPAAQSDAVVLAVERAPATLDPVQAADATSRLLARQLFAPLLAPQGKGLATASVDGDKVTLSIREGATWSDGAPVVTDDVIAAWRHVLVVGTPQAKRNLFPIRGAEAFAAGRAVHLDASAVRLRGPPFVSSGDTLTGGTFVAAKAGAQAVVIDSNLRRAKHVTALVAEPRADAPKIAWLGRGQRALIVEERRVGDDLWLSLRTPDGAEAGWAKPDAVTIDVLPPGYAIVDTGAQGTVALLTQPAADATPLRTVFDGDVVLVKRHERGMAAVFHRSSGLKGYLSDSDIDDTLSDRLWVRVKTTNENGALQQGWVAARDLVSDETLGYRRVSDKVLETWVERGRPASALLTAFGDVQATALPAHRLSRLGSAWAGVGQVVSSGDYTLTPLSPQRWRFSPRVSGARAVDLRIAPDDVMVLAAYRRGEIDVAWQISFSPFAHEALTEVAARPSPSARRLSLRARPDDVGQACILAHAFSAAMKDTWTGPGRIVSPNCEPAERRRDVPITIGADRLSLIVKHALQESIDDATPLRFVARAGGDESAMTLVRTAPVTASVFSPRQQAALSTDIPLLAFDAYTLWNKKVFAGTMLDERFMFSSFAGEP